MVFFWYQTDGDNCVPPLERQAVRKKESDCRTGNPEPYVRSSWSILDQYRAFFVMEAE